jgi:hypothetical protein
MLDAETGETQLINTGSKQFDSITRNYNERLNYFKETFKSGSG